MAWTLKEAPKASIMLTAGNKAYIIGKKAEDDSGDSKIILTNFQGNIDSDGEKKNVDVCINS